MATLTRDDGIEIHWEEQGDGPLVVLASYWSFHPSVFDPVTAELARDHRVVRYDDRGTGRSTRRGPYDMKTAADDLQAVVEAAGGSALALCTADGPHRATRVAARRPDLIETVVSIGGAPVGRNALEGADAMAASEAVVGALLDLARTDYRAALRSLIAAGNPQMSEDEVRERINAQVEYAPAEPSVERLGAWIEADSIEEARALGGRLWLLHGAGMAGTWLPQAREYAALLRRVLPEANVAEVEDGWVSRPDLSADVVRGLTARTRAAPA